MNGILIVNKPSGWTSHDVVAKTRRLLGEKRIGHSGTLDPIATGVLPLFIGRATRAVEFAEAADKEYIAGLRLGLTSDTHDITGNITAVPHPHITDSDFLSVLNSFTGDIVQVPPMYSAIKINGKKLYEYARQGKIIERPPRNIQIRELELLRKHEQDYFIRVVCSKGTYIRVLCADIGEALGCGGIMSSLIRTRAGDFHISSAHTLSTIESCAASARINSLLLPIDSLFMSLAPISVSAKMERYCKTGRTLPLQLTAGRYRIYSETGEFLMLADSNGTLLKTVKTFYNTDSSIGDK